MTNVTCTRAGLTLDGRPFYLLAGQIHYFRYPRAEWRDILLKARAAGLNAIDTVIPWNLHEPRPGQFNFEDLADLPGYIDLCAELGLYVIARPGPYICAEWENGGLPAWLARAPEIVYRLDHPAYLEPTLRWFDKLIPLLAGRQIDRDGPIILVQIENEHWASGVYGHDAHQATLAEAMQGRGISVPLYTCMGAGGDWPEFRNGWTGIDKKLVQTQALWPDTPLIVSELWSGWFDDWGSSRHTGKTPASLDQRLHELTAIGAAGFSHWMWAGGTNFAFWGGRTVGGDTIHMTTSYDYDAPVSEYGGLTGKYFVARRHHLLLGTLGSRLASLLTGANSGGPTVIPPKAIAGRAAGGGEPLRNVHHGDFTATYLRNDTPERQTYQLFIPSSDVPRTMHHASRTSAKPPRGTYRASTQGQATPSPNYQLPITNYHLSIDVEPFTIKPVFTHLPLTDRLTLLYHTGRLLGFWSMAGAEVLVIYGFEGEQGDVALAGAGWQIIDAGGATCQIDGDTLHIKYWLTDRPTVVSVSFTASSSNVPSPTSPSPNLPTSQLHLLLLTQPRAERCWPVGEQGFLVGPHYLYDYAVDEAKITARVDGRGSSPFYWVGGDGIRQRLEPIPGEAPSVPPALGPWQRLAVEELESEEDWRSIEQPQPFERLGCDLGYGWYRAGVEVTGNEEISLAAPGINDRGHLFVDGEYVGTLGIDPAGPTLAVPVTFSPGEHDLRLLVDNLGRFNYGSNLGERKGLTDTLYGGGRQTDLTRGWVALWQEAYFAGEAIAGARPAHVRADAVGVDLASFPFSGSDVWLLREFQVPTGRRALLYLTGDRNPGALYVNGHEVARFSRHYGGGFLKYDVTAWLKDGEANTLALHLRDYAGLAWRAQLLTYDPTQPLPAAWGFRAGVTPAAGHRPPAADEPLPAFYQTRFAYSPEQHGRGPFKLGLYGLTKGQLWLNGHNLGRYWQIGPQEFYKVPVSWLKAENELLIFEEGGGAPEEVRLWVDELGLDQVTTVEIDL